MEGFAVKINKKLYVIQIPTKLTVNLSMLDDSDVLYLEVTFLCASITRNIQKHIIDNLDEKNKHIKSICLNVSNKTKKRLKQKRLTLSEGFNLNGFIFDGQLGEVLTDAKFEFIESGDIITYVEQKLRYPLCLVRNGGIIQPHNNNKMQAA